jgi:hypothetical protein
VSKSQDFAAFKPRAEYCATVIISALHYTIRQQLVTIRAALQTSGLCVEPESSRISNTFENVLYLISGAIKLNQNFFNRRQVTGNVIASTD